MFKRGLIDGIHPHKAKGSLTLRSANINMVIVNTETNISTTTGKALSPTMELAPTSDYWL